MTTPSHQPPEPPITFHPQEESDDDGGIEPFSYLIGTVVSLGLAIGLLLPGVWSGQIDIGGGRRVFVRSILIHIGQYPLAGGLAVLGLILLTLAIRGFRRERDA